MNNILHPLPSCFCCIHITHLLLAVWIGNRSAWQSSCNPLVQLFCLSTVPLKHHVSPENCQEHLIPMTREKVHTFPELLISLQDFLDIPDLYFGARKLFANARGNRMLSALRETASDHSLDARYSCVKQTSSRRVFPGCVYWAGTWRATRHIPGACRLPGKS